MTFGAIPQCPACGSVVEIDEGIAECASCRRNWGVNDL